MERVSPRQPLRACRVIAVSGPNPRMLQRYGLTGPSIDDHEPPLTQAVRWIDKLERAGAVMRIEVLE